jgi:hypothetical protein
LRPAKAVKILKFDRFGIFFEDMIAKSHIDKVSLLSISKVYPKIAVALDKNGLCARMEENGF